MISYVSKSILRFWGFAVEGDLGKSLPKKIFAVVPHTSAIDFLVGILLRSAYKMKVNFIGKKSLFRPPLGYIMSRLGGYPIDRSKRENKVELIAKLIREQQRFALAIAPEGTRQKVEKLRTGFYHIARLAGIPIILVRFDFGSKTIQFSPPFYPTDNQEDDFKYFDNFFRGASGYHPSLSYNPPHQ